MKKMICILVGLLLLCGCGKNKDEIKAPVNFYYNNADITYNSLTGVMSPEVRDGTGYNENLASLLDLYFAGPLSDEFQSPFPTGTITIHVFQEDTTLYIELSKAFSELKGLDLTIACACLTKTVTELTGCSAVNIYVAETTLDGNTSLTIDINDLLFLNEII